MGYCDTSRCGAICCTFITIPWPIDTTSVRLYWRLHGVEYKSDGGQGLILKLPLPCTALDPQTKRCTIYGSRPNACRISPQHESPWIPKEQCSQLTP